MSNSLGDTPRSNYLTPGLWEPEHFSEDCWCQPLLSDQDGEPVIVHNSLMSLAIELTKNPQALGLGARDETELGQFPQNFASWAATPSPHH